ncbi:MAG: hypothetical protein ACI4RU_01305 [Acutalibacteraceae bacterium]
MQFFNSNISTSLSRKGAWVISTINGTCKHKEAFYIDKTVTTVLKTGGIIFPELLSTEKNYKTTDVLNITQNHSTSAEKLGTYN